jgi:hypothetical protein
MTPPKDTTIIYWRFSCLVCICSVISKMLHRYTPLYLSSINNNKMSTNESLRSQRKINKHCSCSWPNALDSSKVQSSTSCTTRDIQYTFHCHNAYTHAHTHTLSLSLSVCVSLFISSSSSSSSPQIPLQWIGMVPQKAPKLLT